MTIMEVVGNVNKKKRKQKQNADENDCRQAAVKAAKMYEEKKLFARKPHNSDVRMKSDLKNERKKLKQMQKPIRTDGNKWKSKMVLDGKEGKVKVITKDGNSKTKTKDLKKKTSPGDVKTKNVKSKEESVKLESMKKKDRKKLRKMKSANFEIASQAKALWEECRRFDLTPEKKAACIADLFKLVLGHTKSLIFAHDTSRVIQTLMKYGTSEMRDTIFHELKDHLIDIMKWKYSKFFIRKLLAYGSKVHRDFVFTAMHGKLRKLLRHRV